MATNVQELLDQLNSLSTVTEDFVLPTKGKLDGIDSKVTLRMMTTHEEKIRTGSNSSFWRTISSIINKCIVSPKGIDVYNLTVIDFIFLMYKLRIVSYGKDYKVNLTRCPHCSKKLKDVSVNLDELKVTYIDDLEEEFKEPYEIELPISKWKVGCKLLRMKDFDSISNEVDKILEEFPNYEGDPSVPLRLVKQIETINGEKIDKVSLQSIVDRLPAADENKITKSLEKIDIGMDLNAEYKCPKCGKMIRIPLSYTEEFFRPTSE